MNLTERHDQSLRTELAQLKIRAELIQIQTELSKLRAKANRKTFTTSTRFARYLIALDEKREKFIDRLEFIGETGDGSLTELKKDLKGAWHQLDIARQAAKARFQ